jgi:peptidoglycan/xylan/chitin deacetylase (PgdA/CDA1 family)
MQLPILTFHAIDDRPSAISFSPSLFQRAMAQLHAQGFRTLELSDGVEKLLRGEPLPARSLVIAFDDGYRSVYTDALPVLARYGMTATVFLTTGDQPPASPCQRPPALQGRTMLSWSEARDMQAAGITFGAHTLTHPDLTQLADTEIERQLSRSQDIIEDALGAPASTFAYPYGRHNRQSRDIAGRRFACACSDSLGLATGKSDRWALERVDAYYLRSPLWLHLLKSRLFPCYLHARNGPRRLRRTLLSRIPS